MWHSGTPFGDKHGGAGLDLVILEGFPSLDPGILGPQGVAGSPFFRAGGHGTHGALDAPRRLPEELGFGVGHLGGVEQLLALHLLQDQHPLEHFGG